MGDLEKFIKEVCENCSQFYDCDSFWDENNILKCMKNNGETDNEKRRNP